MVPAEAGSNDASIILEIAKCLIDPDVLIIEFGNALRKMVKRGELDQADAEEIVDVFISSTPVSLQPVSVFLRPVFDIASRWQTTVYDTLYVAPAPAKACPLVPAGERLVKRFQGTVLGKSILILGELKVADAL